MSIFNFSTVTAALSTKEPAAIRAALEFLNTQGASIFSTTGAKTYRIAGCVCVSHRSNPTHTDTTYSLTPTNESPIHGDSDARISPKSISTIISDASFKTSGLNFNLSKLSVADFSAITGALSTENHGAIRIALGYLNERQAKDSPAGGARIYRIIGYVRILLCSV